MALHDENPISTGPFPHSKGIPSQGAGLTEDLKGGIEGLCHISQLQKNVVFTTGESKDAASQFAA